ncbi:hypothetical protein COLO4_30569 [Corchorus olitorius]|uniref:Neprosin PEP catalytic domain-containing protein n=1 Tax=Corchorus olitorius TaxID=93759 RepID=A0A1R3H829_9ROSI|nr:hypothetical protein COLO4_30569 [Corchorus olitorius]
MDTSNRKKTKLGYSIFVFVALYHMLSHVHVHGRSISSDKSKTMELAKHKGTVKTIQMKPSHYPTGMNVEKFDLNLLQGYIKCPEGTVPIDRSPINNFTLSKFPPGKYEPQDDRSNHEYATVIVSDGNYFGASAWLNVWHPATFNGEISISQFWIVSGHGNEFNSIEAGWISDNYRSTGCYDLHCSGFVQTSNQRLLGTGISPISTYGGKQFDILLTVHKDKQSGNWWLRFHDIDIGYWPSSILSKLSDRAAVISWGGEIVNSKAGGRHTTTEMGNGHLPDEGFRFAAYMRNLAFFDESGAAIDAEDIEPYAVTRPECYDLKIPTKNKDWGKHFYFGGPGWSDQCP